jgi:hypothetical protein
MQALEIYSRAVILKRPPLYYKKGRPKSIRETVLMNMKRFKYATILEKIVLINLFWSFKNSGNCKQKYDSNLQRCYGKIQRR